MVHSVCPLCRRCLSVRLLALQGMAEQFFMEALPSEFKKAKLNQAGLVLKGIYQLLSYPSLRADMFPLFQ